MHKFSVGVLGASGYAGRELCLLVERHPSLELAFATPRGWLRDGKTIAVRDAPTSFGPLSYSIARTGNTIRFDVQGPPRPVHSLRLRLRLPHGTAIRSVDVGGRAVRFDRSTGTIDLPSAGATSGYVVVGRTM